jgi:hypothetical protein
MKKNQKSVTSWLTDAEHDALTALASAQKKTVTAYTTALLRLHISGKDQPQTDNGEALLDLQRQTQDTIKKIQEGLCYAALKLIQKGSNPLFETDKEAHEWVLINVGRKE